MADTSRLGRYEIRREIARSNDIVYEAIDTLIGRKVALKELSLPPNLVGQAKRDRIERFYREARAAGALTHRNVVTIFEVGEEMGRHFIAMEFLEGQSLRQLLDTEGALSLPRVRDILLQVLEALAYAHQNGVVHRDIKPDNLYLLHDGTVKLTDFGIARIMEEPSLTSEGQVFGTPSYMSPEQIAGRTIDERTDLYSVGIMGFEMIAGRKPFVGENVVALTYQILNVQPEPPRGAPPEWAAFLQKAMAKDPSRRYQSAQQMIDALRTPPDSGAPLFSSPPMGAFSSFPATSTGLPSFSLPDPTSLAGGTLTSGQVPTIPPYPLPRRWRLTREMRHFMMALTGGLLLGCLIVALTMGVRSAYQKYSRDMREQAMTAVYMDAVQLYKSGKFDAAIPEFQKVERQAWGTPMAAHAQDAIVQSYLSLGDPLVDQDLNMARFYFERAVQANPNDPEAHLQLGDVYQRLGYFDAANQEWDRVIDLDGLGGEWSAKARSLQATLWYNRGIWAINSGNRDLAVQMWQKAVLADPDSPIANEADEEIHRVSPPAFPGY